MVVEAAPDNTYKIFGPPGTGKTTYLAKQIERAVFARGADAVVVASLTRAAAAEIVGRGLPLADRGQAGTLHAIARRALGISVIAETLAKEWNTEHPGLALTQQAGDPDDPWGGGAGEGDECYNALQTFRAKMLSPAVWPPRIQHFAREWDAFKQETGSVDFTDMIALCLTDVDVAPGDPAIGIYDETQDFTPLELALVRKWAAHMDQVLMAGDDDQALYAFRGATPDAFLDPPSDVAHTRILGQSHRVPRLVQALAQGWVSRLTRREAKPYLPRDVEGDVRALGVSLRAPSALVYAAEPYLARTTTLADGTVRPKTVMFLATCGYLLDPLKYELRRQGIPFGNKWKAKRGDWNPLRHRAGTVSAADRILAFLAPHLRAANGTPGTLWTGAELARWASALRAEGTLLRGKKQQIEKLAGTRPLAMSEITPYFEADVPEQARAGGLAWYQDHLVDSSRKTMDFPLTVAARRGARALLEEPQVTIGTIHSVKGSEADVVFLAPDVSTAGYTEWCRPGPPQDSVVRQFYVGMTRAYETLVMLDSCGGPAVPLPRRVERYSEEI